MWNFNKNSNNEEIGKQRPVRVTVGIWGLPKEFEGYPMDQRATQKDPQTYEGPKDTPSNLIAATPGLWGLHRGCGGWHNGLRDSLRDIAETFN